MLQNLKKNKVEADQAFSVLKAAASQRPRPATAEKEHAPPPAPKAQPQPPVITRETKVPANKERTISDMPSLAVPLQARRPSVERKIVPDQIVEQTVLRPVTESIEVPPPTPRSVPGEIDADQRRLVTLMAAEKAATPATVTEYIAAEPLRRTVETAATDISPDPTEYEIQEVASLVATTAEIAANESWQEGQVLNVELSDELPVLADEAPETTYDVPAETEWSAEIAAISDNESNEWSEELVAVEPLETEQVAETDVVPFDVEDVEPVASERVAELSEEDAAEVPLSFENTASESTETPDKAYDAETMSIYEELARMSPTEHDVQSETEVGPVDAPLVAAETPLDVPLALAEAPSEVAELQVADTGPTEATVPGITQEAEGEIVHSMSPEQPLAAAFELLKEIAQNTAETLDRDEILQIVEEIRNELPGSYTSQEGPGLERRITPEMTLLLIKLLRVLGYQNPRDVLVGFVAEHDIAYLLRSLENACGAFREGGRGEVYQSTFSTDTPDEDSARLHIGRLLFGLIARTDSEPAV